MISVICALHVGRLDEVLRGKLLQSKKAAMFPITETWRRLELKRWVVRSQALWQERMNSYQVNKAFTQDVEIKQSLCAVR